jgi:hypothetical protein
VGVLERILGESERTAVVEVVDDRITEQDLVYQTKLDRLALMGLEIKTQEALHSQHRLVQDGAAEFQGAIADLTRLEKDAPDALTRSLMREYNAHALHRLANTAQRFITIAADSQARILERPVDRRP